MNYLNVNASNFYIFGDYLKITRSIVKEFLALAIGFFQ